MMESMPQNAIIEAAKELTKPLYNDVAQPTAKKIGEALERTFSGTVGWAIMPFYYSAAYRDVLIRRLEKIKEILSEIHEKQIVEQIHPQIAGPIFENLRFIEEDGFLEKMYLELLATSMNKDEVANAHPAFTALIQQLSPDEALLLNAIGMNVFKRKFKLGKLISCNLPSMGFTFSENLDMYLSHLKMLNIVQIQDYEQNIAEDWEAGTRTVGGIEQEIQLTDFGVKFINACGGKH